jgi:gluconokinase
MGVQGSGKTTIGHLLAKRLGVPFIDGDSLHPASNKEWMGSGHALTDSQRLPWLDDVGECLASGAGSGIVVACSALRRSYRDLLRAHEPAMFTVFARGDVDLITARIAARVHEYMPASLLLTQFDELEELAPDELGLTVDIAKTPMETVDEIMAALSEEPPPSEQGPRSEQGSPTEQGPPTEAGR